MSQQTLPNDVIAILRRGTPPGREHDGPSPQACGQPLPSKRRCPAARVGLHGGRCAFHSGSYGVRAPQVDMAAAEGLLELWAASGIPPAAPDVPSAAVALRMAAQGDMSGIEATATALVARATAAETRAATAERDLATLRAADEARIQRLHEEGQAALRAQAEQQRRWQVLAATETGRRILRAEIGTDRITPLPPSPTYLPIERWRRQRAGTGMGRAFLASVDIPATGPLTRDQRERAGNLILASGFLPEGA